MNEVEIKIAEAIKELTRLLLPMGTNHEEQHNIEASLCVLKDTLINVVGRRVIKGSK